MKYAYIAAALSLTAIATVYFVPPFTGAETGEVSVVAAVAPKYPGANLNPLDDPALLYQQPDRVMEQGELTLPACGYCDLQMPKIDLVASGEATPAATWGYDWWARTHQYATEIEGSPIVTTPTLIARNR